MNRTGLAGRVLLAALVVAFAVGLAAPPAAYAQDGKRGESLSWDDAPLVPRHRSEADWLIDVGWKTYDEVYGPFPTRPYAVEDTEQFVPLGSGDAQTETFVLYARTDHAYFWFERGVRVDPAEMEQAARFFETHIWPLNHRIYGNEWNPGIDGDSRIHIVNQAVIAPGIMGAFNPDDQCPRSLCPESNQREIIYVNLDNAPLGSPEYLTTIAHEQQHLIQYTVDGNERRWFNEGLSQLAEHLNGFAPRYVGDYNLFDFLNDPDLHLNGWSFAGADIGRHYGAAYLFLVYLYERFGLVFIQTVAGSDYDGLASVQEALASTGQGVTVDDVFADWILANYFDDPYVGNGQYYYQTLDLPNHIDPLPLLFSQGAAAYVDTVNQYGADYLSLEEPGTYNISIDGSDQAVVIDTVPQSGDWMWWSYNDSSSAARLTAPFDLAGLDAVTLAFSAWWDVEQDYDWFQVLVSDDGGKDWAIVSGSQAAQNGTKAPGAFYSGSSGAWIDERVDLSAYAGRQIVVRFEYLTDVAETGQGVALDDIGIVELGRLDDVESAASAWVPEGFLRIPASVAQHWTVTVITRPAAVSGAHPTAQAVPLDALNTGRATVSVPDGGSATIVIGAMAPFTAVPASYKLTAERVP